MTVVRRVCDLETLRVRSWPTLDRSATGKQNTSTLVTFLTLPRSIDACDSQIAWRVPNGLLHENVTKQRVSQNGLDT